MKRILKFPLLFIIGGILYCLIELAARGYTHWTMGIVGGFCFVLIGLLNEFFDWSIPLFDQGLIGSFIVTAAELISGIILNIHLGLDIWDYSNMPFNFLGQICLPFTILWIFVSMIAVIVDDWLRYLIDKLLNYLSKGRYNIEEEMPHYKIF